MLLHFNHERIIIVLCGVFFWLPFPPNSTARDDLIQMQSFMKVSPFYIFNLNLKMVFIYNLNRSCTKRYTHV